jgi:hypothetical protein
MMLPSSAGDVRPDHVVFDLESIDRIPESVCAAVAADGGAAGFIYGRLGRPMRSGPTLVAGQALDRQPRSSGS